MEKLKVLVIGAGGYLGSNLLQYLTKKQYDVFGTYHKLPFNSELQTQKCSSEDILNYRSIEEIIQKVSPNIIIHAAGLNSLAECEKNPNLAFKINVEGARNIIKAIKHVNPRIKLVFISSDYVFAGTKGNYKETDPVNPQTYYGKTKVHVEKEISSNLQNFIICRTANVYGHGGNFFKFVYDSLTNNKPIEVYNDVTYTPTYISYFLDSIDRLLQQNFTGFIHIAGKESTTRYEFAHAMAVLLNKDLSLLIPVSQPPEGLIAKDSSLNSEYAHDILKNYSPTIEKSLMYSLEYLIDPYFYHQDDRGKIVGLLQGYPWEEINYIESEKDTIRGNHYHKTTVEGFYIIEGSIIVSLTDLISGKTQKFKVECGDCFRVLPNIIHQFEVKTNSKWINMLSKSMDGDKDIYRNA